MKKEKTYPMMLSYEVLAIEKMLLEKSEHEIRFLEWGSGFSTIYFTNFLKKNNIKYTWVSVEDDNEWYKYVKSQLNDDENTHLFLETEQNRYVKKPNEVFKRFDIALVDGKKEWRNDCIVEAKKIADVVLLHDAQRKSYLPLAQGTFLAGRLLKIGPNRPLTRFIQLGRYHIHKAMWETKQLFLGK